MKRIPGISTGVPSGKLVWIHTQFEGFLDEFDRLRFNQGEVGVS